MPRRAAARARNLCRNSRAAISTDMPASARQAPDITAPDHHRQPPGCGGITDEALVGVARPSAQLVVEVGDGEFPTSGRGKTVEQREQDHRIKPAGNGDENFLAVAEKLLRADAGLKLPWQIQVQGSEFRAGNGLEQDSISQICSLTKDFVSGHTLKHLAAAVAVYWVLRMLQRRSPAKSVGVCAPPPNCIVPD